jgi:hypothetical protein
MPQHAFGSLANAPYAVATESGIVMKTRFPVDDSLPMQLCMMPFSCRLVGV